MTSNTYPLLIQVLPRLRPGWCGVSDQAVPLARELKARFGIDSAFVVLNSNERWTSPHATIYSPATGLLESCLELTQGRPGALLIHVSGYGYSADGAPTLLANGLEKVGASGQFRTAAYFHETYATGPPWKSAFWYTRRQKRALRRLLVQCGLILTNIGRHAEWLGREAQATGGVPVERMPVFSGVGESEVPLSFAQRNPAMVVFGRAGTREWAYGKLAAGDLLSIFGIREILDIGPECHHPADINGVRVKPMGLLPADDLPGVFSAAQFGFVPHPWYCLGKSSVFAAFCAQGTVPVLGEPFPEEADGLIDGVHVVSPQTAEVVRRSGWEDCSRAAWNWYMGHRLRFHAERYARWIGEQG
jgi:hypothetical protein